jgi:hypothetical protein
MRIHFGFAGETFHAREAAMLNMIKLHSESERSVRIDSRHDVRL